MYECIQYDNGLFNLHSTEHGSEVMMMMMINLTVATPLRKASPQAQMECNNRPSVEGQGSVVWVHNRCPSWINPVDLWYVFSAR